MHPHLFVGQSKSLSRASHGKSWADTETFSGTVSTFCLLFWFYPNPQNWVNICNQKLHCGLHEFMHMSVRASKSCSHLLKNCCNRLATAALALLRKFRNAEDVSISFEHRVCKTACSFMNVASLVSRCVPPVPADSSLPGSFCPRRRWRARWPAGHVADRSGPPSSSDFRIRFINRSQSTSCFARCCWWENLVSNSPAG